MSRTGDDLLARMVCKSGTPLRLAVYASIKWSNRSIPASNNNPANLMPSMSLTFSAEEEDGYIDCLNLEDYH